MDTVIVGERGQITIPKELRERYGIEPRKPVIIEERDGEIVIKPSAVIPISELKKLTRNFDDKFIKKLVKENELKVNEKEILKKWRN